MKDSAQPAPAEDRRRKRGPSLRPGEVTDDDSRTNTDPHREFGSANGEGLAGDTAESENQAARDGDTSGNVMEHEDDCPADLSYTDRLVVDNVGVLKVYLQDHRSGGVYVSGGSVRSELLAGRDAPIAGAETNTAPTVSVSALSAEELARLRAVTVRVACHADAAVILEQDRFVLLRGPAGAGKHAAQWHCSLIHTPFLISTHQWPWMLFSILQHGSASRVLTTISSSHSYRRLPAP